MTSQQKYLIYETINHQWFFDNKLSLIVAVSSLLFLPIKATNKYDMIQVFC